MKTVSMSGSLRENVGKKDAKRNRNEGFIPCVLYGGKEQIHFTLEEKPFGKLIFTPEVYQVHLSIGGKEHHAILQDVQYHPVSDRVLHADFLEILPDKQIVVSIPLKMEGTAPGILKGGKLIQKLRKLKVKGLAKHIPDYIILNISSLEIGDSIKVGDVAIEHLQFMDPPTAVIAGVRTTRAAEEGAPGEAAKEGGAAETSK